MPVIGAFVLLLSLAVQVACQGITISLIPPDNVIVNMYNAGQYNSLFVKQSSPFNCSINGIYTYSQNSQQQKL